MKKAFMIFCCWLNGCELWQALEDDQWLVKGRLYYVVRNGKESRLFPFWGKQVLAVTDIERHKFKRIY